MRLQASTASLVLAMLLGCSSDPTAVICTEEARPGILVHVRHAVTDEPAAEGATLTLTDGSFQQVVDQTTVLGLSLWGAVERPGTYDVRVEKVGFRTWQRAGVVVALTEDGCHVVTVVLEVKLEPLG